MGRGTVVALALAGAGAAYAYFLLDTGAFVRDAWVFVAIVGFVPGVRRAIAAAASALDRASPRRVAPILFSLSLAFLVIDAAGHGRERLAKIHDEQMFLLQARMVSTGHLWLPTHPLADFFETFHVFVKPVYAPMYFPGTALLYGVGLLLHVPPWVISACVMAAMVAMLYRVVAELVSGSWGVVAALLVLSLPTTRVLSTAVFSYPLMNLLALTILWAWLRWRTTRSARWTIAIGVLTGWALITRPVDALCLSAPLLAAMLWEGRRWQSLATVAACAVPFVGLQLWMNHAVTGSWIQTPVAAYNAAHWPGNALSLPGRLPSERPALRLAQFRKYEQTFVEPAVQAYHQKSWLRTLWRRVPIYFHPTLPSPYLFLLVPVGLLGLSTTGRRVMLAGALLGALSYAFFPSLIGVYCWMAAPAIALLVVLGASRFGPPVMLACIVLAIVSLARYPAGLERDMFDKPSITDSNRQLATIDRTPAVVLFRFDPAVDSAEEEPVYNLATAWPDDAAVIRAHDLGAENSRIFAYYPDRAFYLYERATRRLTYLGAGRELAAAPKS